MTDNRPPLPSVSSTDSRGEGYGDPFADRPRQTQFAESPYIAHHAPGPQAYDSAVNIPSEFGGHDYEDEDDVENQPLNANQNFTGGFYPPGSAHCSRTSILADIPIVLSTQIVLGTLTLVDLHQWYPLPPTGLTAHGVAARQSSVV